MLSIAQRTDFCQAFKMLTKFEKQLIALKCICHQTHDERAIIKMLKAGAVPHSDGVFSEQLYRALILTLHKLGFIVNKDALIIPPELHHELLVLMSDEDMKWVYDMADHLCENSWSYHDNSHLTARAQLIMVIYQNQTEKFTTRQNEQAYCNWLVCVLNDIFDSSCVNLEWLQSRKTIIREYICIALLGKYYCDAAPVINSKEILEFFVSNINDDTKNDYLQYYSAIIHLSIGNIEAAHTYCERIQSASCGYVLALKATFAFLNMECDQAGKLYRKALAALRKETQITSYYFDNILGIFHAFFLSFIEKNHKQLSTNAANYHKYFEGYWAMPLYSCYWLFQAIGLIESGNSKGAERELHSLVQNPDKIKQPLHAFVYYLMLYIANKDNFNQKLDAVFQLLHLSIQDNHKLAAHLFCELLVKTEKYQQEVRAHLDGSPFNLRLLNFIQAKETWEYSFQALKDLLVEGGPKAGESGKNKRLMWLIDPDRHLVDVVEQSRNKSGQWSHGRQISLSKLKHHVSEPHFNYLSPQDILVIAGIREENDDWRGTASYHFSPHHCFLALVNHPHLAHCQNREISIELVKNEPELHIEETPQGYHFSLSHFLPQPGFIIEPESLNKYRVIDYSTAFASIGNIITEKGLTIPANAKDKILDIIHNAKRDIKIHVGIKDPDIPEIAGDATPCIQLLPMNEGVRATLWIKPLSYHGSYFKIAQGKESFMAIVPENGVERRVRVQRHFSAEKKHQQTLLAQCPSLLRHEYDVGEYEIESPEDVLEMLSELQQYATTQTLTIEWPQGQTFKIKQRVNGTHLSLRISSENKWFEYDGKMTLDDGEVLYMQELLQALDTKAYGRFIRLGNGEFIELTSQLKKQLSLLHALSDDQKINPLGAQVLSDIAAQAENTVFDAGWKSHLKKIKSMRTHAPEVPSTLQTTLRDYQIEGFQHLSRLTQWGIGACLADDMGLGKTVQTIALLLERAKHGPSLVVAPTSVCFNWIEELNKFAPTLNAWDLRKDDRANLVTQADKFDVLVCSYGLLQHNEDLLVDKSWETIVLDEAQAIKNAQTQRWKTVMKLKSKGRIALSGTPIENHLGELWSIFSFINPGLLGSLKNYQNKYAAPIETGQSPDRILALRALVQPYILRRIKSDVLKELPPKTEQTIHVEPSDEEKTFYEALRRTTEERMKVLMTENDRIRVLAEITRLRQACCDSSLIDSSLDIENSKLNAFIETIKNIIDNGHKALVFSQFVSFLNIIKKRIEAEKIAYQYLDGTTSAAKRKKSVEAFQNGEGDLFLLSLKAGGSGLNLTAADYVIHMDPWWNPAVEDQASDRAHRIGQERPVTIYRFVMRNTIEEKIIALHEHKRNLATELLSGQEMSGKLSNDDLMNLISAPLKLSSCTFDDVKL